MSSGPGRLPDFLIIGAQKSASTALTAALQRHPEAWLPAFEDHYLHDPFFGAESRESFAARYAGRTEKRVGLKCPDYLGLPEVPRRVSDVLGEPDVIVCLRDPIDRFVSAYYWYMRWGVIPILPLEEGARRLLRGDYDHLPMARHVLDFGLYASHLKGWREHVPEEHLLVLLLEDVHAEAESSVKQMLGFLSLGADRLGDGTLTTGANPGVYPMFRVRFLQAQTRRLSVWDPTETYLTLQRPRSPARRLTALGVRAVDRYVWEPLLGNNRPPMSPSLRAQLAEFYASDVADLEKLIRRDLSSWCT